MLIKLDRYWLSTVSLAWPRETAGVGRLVDGRSVAGWSLRAAGGRGGVPDGVLTYCGSEVVE